MTELRKRVVRAICVERCSAVGDPPCHTLDGYDGTDCDDVAGASCGHLADAVLAAVAAGPTGRVAYEAQEDKGMTTDERIPCAVAVAPATIFRAGVSLRTVIDRIRCAPRPADVSPAALGAMVDPAAIIDGGD